MSKTNIFIFSAIFYLSGIFINNYIKNIYNSLFILLFIVVFFLIFYFVKKKYFLLLLFSIFGFLFGIFLSNYNLTKVQNNLNFLSNFQEKTDIILSIKNLKQINNDYKIYIGKINKIGTKTPKNTILIEVFTKGNYNLEKGDIIKINSKAYFYKNTSSFKYKNYMLSQNIYFKTYPYFFDVIEKNNLNILEKNIILLREFFLSKIKEIYPENEAIFLGGILFGAREEMPKTLKTNFNNSGLTHFIAVSGFNITILIIFFGFFIKPLANYLKIIIISLIILFFTYLVGFGAPVIRASIMGLIGFFIVSIGRQSNILSIIFLTAIIMISFLPLSLNYDVSLHLSFLAVLGIIYTEKWFEKIFYFVPKILEIRTALSITFAALTFTLPIMIFNFGQISILAPITNILVTWTIPIAMGLGFTSIIIFSFFKLGGIIIGYLAWIFLKWDILVVNFFGELKWSVFKYDFGENASYYEIIYFILLIFIILWFKKKEEK